MKRDETPQPPRILPFSAPRTSRGPRRRLAPGFGFLVGVFLVALTGCSAARVEVAPAPYREEPCQPDVNAQPVDKVKYEIHRIEELSGQKRDGTKVEKLGVYDGQHGGGDADACTSVCEAATGICASADEICAIYASHRDDPSFKSDCEWAQGVCTSSNNECTGCPER